MATVRTPNARVPVDKFIIVGGPSAQVLASDAQGAVSGSTVMVRLVVKTGASEHTFKAVVGLVTHELQKLIKGKEFAGTYKGKCVRGRYNQQDQSGSFAFA